MLLANGGSLYIRSSEDAKITNTLAWKTILDSSNYSGILDSRYYTESEVNSLLDAKLNRQNLSYGTWNPRGYNLAADYYYNGGDLSISESGGKIHISVDGYFWQNEGQYRVLDTSDVAGLKNNLTVHQYLSNTDTTWWPLIWGGSSHNNTSDSTGTVYKSYDKLCWQTSSQTLYATNIQTENIKHLSIGGGIYWNPYVELTTDGSDAASITVVKSGVAGGTTLVLSQMNDANDTIQFQTNGSARLYHNSYPILTTQNTYVSNNKGYINGTEITQVNNADMLDGYHLSTLVNKSGENLITGTTHASTIGWNQNGWSGGISTYDENNGVYKIWSTNGWHTLYYTLNSQYASKSISFSFDIMFISSESTEGPVGVYVSSSNIYIGGTNYCPSNSDLWEHKQGKITLGSTPYFGIMIRGTDNSGKSCFYLIKNLKVELGDLPTIWTPAHADITWNNLTGKPSSFIPSAHTHPYLPLSGGTMTGVIKSVFESGTWINGVTNAIIKGEYTKYGAILSIPVKNGRISLSSFPANDNNIYFGYATTQQINTGTNAFNKEMYWDAPNNNLHADIFTGTLAGNAFTATKLQTARTIWGQSFDGTADVSGFLSNVGSISFLANNTYDVGSNTNAIRYIYTHWLGAKSGQKLELGANNSNFGQGLCIDTNLNVGIGTNTPAYKLDVKGNIGVTGQIIRGAFDQSWVNGRRGALLRETTSISYHTLWSLKTTNGSWDFGEYNFSGWNNIPVLSYITDTNFNSGNNTPTYQIKFPLDSGTIALTKNIPTSLPANGGNADMVDSYHANGLLTSVTNTNNGISVTVGGTTKSVSNISVNYASNAGNADTATTSSMLKTADWNGPMYVSSDTHYMCLGYMNCTGSYDSLTLLVTSAFWGNQHGSQDIITIQQSTNTNDTARIQTTVGRLRLGGSYERSFYYYKDNSNFRLYLYVYVTGGNSYGRWNISYLGGNVTWVTAHQENVTKSSSWIGIGYSAQVNYASSAGSATKVIVNQNTTNDTNYPLVWSNQANTNTVTENQLFKSWSDLYYNPKNKRLTVGGSIYAAHFYESSDKALKKNIKSILSSTNIPKIREFDWKDTEEHSYGFIAQELEEQGYGCLVSEANGKKTVNYTATLALTVAKLQNLINIQNKKISNLTKELKALKYGRKKNS